MNREERRSAARRGRAAQAGAKQPAGVIRQAPVTTNFGVRGDRVMLAFSQKIDNLTLTREAAREWLGHIQNALRVLEEQLPKGPPDGKAQR